MNVYVQGKDDARATVTVEHARLADRPTADEMKAYWRDRLVALRRHLEVAAAVAQDPA